MADAILDHLEASQIFDLRGVVAVVTGGGTGIGLMISTTLMTNGATVYIIGPKEEDLNSVAKVYNDAAASKPGKGRMYGLQGDVRLKSEALRLAEEIGKREKHVTVLFNNAGITDGEFVPPAAATTQAFQEAHLSHLTQDHFDNVFRTNTLGPYWLTFAFLPLLEKWKSGENPLSKKFVPQVVITSSMNGWTKDLDTSGRSFPYFFSKAATGQATAALAHELLPLGIRVNGIAPGLFITEMSCPGTKDSFGISHRAQRVFPFEIPANPNGGSNRDMGGLVLMLVANTFINGETVLIDGGTMLKHPSSY